MGHPHPSAVLADLRRFADAVKRSISDFDYYDARQAAHLLTELQLEVTRALVKQYDLGDEASFAGMMSGALGLFSDLRDAADFLGVSVSTIHRWKNGSAIPHALIRESVQVALLRRVDAARADDLTIAAVASNASVGRISTH